MKTTAIRFDRAFERSRENGSPDAEPLSVFLAAGVVRRADRADNHNELGADLSAYLVVHRDDLVFNKLRTWQGGFGRSPHHGIVSPAYFVCRPRPNVSTRYVDYLLHAAPGLSELRRRSKWQPPSQFDLPWDQLRTVRLELPNFDGQRLVADRLDRECARIAAAADAARRLRMATAFEDRSVFERLTATAPTVALRHCLAAIEQGWSPECEAREAAPGEWGVLKVGCVNYGGFRPEEHKRLPTSCSRARRLRCTPATC